jgi:hypothetical protein
MLDLLSNLRVLRILWLLLEQPDAAGAGLSTGEAAS